MRGAGTLAAVAAGVASATIGTGSEGAGTTQGGTDTATVGRTDDTESWDGKGGGKVARNFSDDANPRSGGRA